MPHRHLCAHACFADERGAASGRPFRLPGDRPQWGRPRAFSLDALRLDVDLDLDTRAIDGRAELVLRRVDPEARWAVLDAIDFRIDSLERERDGSREPAAYDYDGEVLRVDLSDLPPGGEARVHVRYRATPRRGLYFTAPDASRPDRPRQVWSQCQDQDGRYWFPCQDHPGQRMRTALTVRVPRGWFALSNGVLLERVEEGERTRFSWEQRQPHPAYLVTLAAGELHEVQTRAGDVPVAYYVPKGREADVERSLGRTAEMIRVFSERLSTPYPWDKYAQVVVAEFIFGGMENTSATTLFERALLDERAALDVDMDALVAHELAHQWFGDLVTCRHWSHAWLNEGFATYMEHVWKEHREGRDAYFYNLEQDLELYLAEAGSRYGRPVVENVWAAPIDVFDRHLYQKGGLVLHALRQHLGDAAFWRGLAFYLERHRGSSVETRDLMRALEDATGRSLEELFHQWIERAGHPALEVRVEPGEGAVKVTVVQTQAKEDEGLFRLGLPRRDRRRGRRERAPRARGLAPRGELLDRHARAAGHGPRRSRDDRAGHGVAQGAAAHARRPAGPRALSPPALAGGPRPRRVERAARHARLGHGAARRRLLGRPRRGRQGPRRAARPRRARRAARRAARRRSARPPRRGDRAREASRRGAGGRPRARARAAGGPELPRRGRAPEVARRPARPARPRRALALRARAPGAGPTRWRPARPRARPAREPRGDRAAPRRPRDRDHPAQRAAGRGVGPRRGAPRPCPIAPRCAACARSPSSSSPRSTRTSASPSRGCSPRWRIRPDPSARSAGPHRPRRAGAARRPGGPPRSVEPAREAARAHGPARRRGEAPQGGA
ncbi:MAG: M1 family metallopeptidase [Sandaracinaceae bacterium]|nr:M1 family metallopeptidase [Sandaracinaceae bacterium]